MAFVAPANAAGVHAGSDLLDLACGPGFVSEAALAAHALPVEIPARPDPARFADADEARAALVEDVERYADGDEFRLPIVARVVSAATPSP